MASSYSFIRKLDYQAKQITYNVYAYYKKKKLDPKTYEHQEDINIIDKVSEVTALSKSTVTRIIREGNAMKAETGVANFRQEDKKKHVRKKRIAVDEVTEGIIRRRVIQFYTVKEEVPSVRKLNALLKEEDILHCSNEYLRQLLHRLGFTNADSESTGMIMERPDIVKERLDYLKAIRKFRELNKDIFYLNETTRWMYNNDDKVTKEDMPSIIIVHAYGSKGFVDGEMTMIKCKPNKKNHHAENCENYDWIINSFLINIPPSSVVVMNMPYSETVEWKQQDEKPTMSSNRAAMQNWLNRRKIPFKDTDLKNNLFELINSHDSKLEHCIDEIIKDSGHDVLHLPQNHQDIDPTLIAWDELKKVGEKFSPTRLFAKYGKKKWQKCFNRVKENESEYYEHDMKMDKAVEMLSTVKVETEDNGMEKEAVESESESEEDEFDFKVEESDVEMNV